MYSSIVAASSHKPETAVNTSGFDTMKHNNIGTGFTDGNPQESVFTSVPGPKHSGLIQHLSVRSLVVTGYPADISLRHASPSLRIAHPHLEVQHSDVCDPDSSF